MPTVSVILNTYNRAALLPRAVDSVIGQTLADWELFICDDASDDDTEAVVRRYLADKRVCYLRQPVRFGNVTKGRNDALDFASGRYVCFLDDDNAMAPDKLERMSQWLDGRPDIGMAYCCSRRMRMDGSLHDILPMNKPADFDRHRLREINYIDSNEVMIRREALDFAGYFDQRAVRFEDWEMWNRIALVTRIAFLNEPLSWYCTHPGQRVLEPGNDQDNLNTRNLLNWKLAHGFPRWRTLIVWPTWQVTISQSDCMAAIARDIADESWIEPRYSTQPGRIVRHLIDAERPALVILWMLFRHPPDMLGALHDCGVPVIGVCVEDPYAVFENMPRMVGISAIFTNERAAAELYRELGQPAAAVMPTLSVCRDWDTVNAPDVDPTHDVVVVGHAYPERIVILRNLATRMPDATFLAVGGAWDGAVLPGNVTIAPAVERRHLVAAYRRGRVVLALNRKFGAPPRLTPHTPARGFIEAVTGRPTVHDNLRADLPCYFEPGNEVLIAENIDQMALQIETLLNDRTMAERVAAAARVRAERYTYAARWRRMVNQIMAARVNDIP